MNKKRINIKPLSIKITKKKNWELKFYLNFFLSSFAVCLSNLRIVSKITKMQAIASAKAAQSEPTRGSSVKTIL